MEVVENNEPLEKKEEKTWNEILADNIAKADKISNQVREKVLPPQFTLEKMAELMRISRNEAADKISFLARFAYLEQKKQGGITFYKIIPDAKDRIKNIEQTCEQLQAKFNGQIDYFQAMQEITFTYLPKETNDKSE